jgi:hypothetical protein
MGNDKNKRRSAATKRQLVAEKAAERLQREENIVAWYAL